MAKKSLSGTWVYDDKGKANGLRVAMPSFVLNNAHHVNTLAQELFEKCVFLEEIIVGENSFTFVSTLIPKQTRQIEESLIEWAGENSHDADSMFLESVDKEPAKAVLRPHRTVTVTVDDMKH